MHRTQINLPDSLYLQLKAHAEKMNKSLSQVIRESVEKYLSERHETPAPTQDPLWKIFGIADSGQGDLAVRHDDYLYGPGRGEKQK